MPMTTNVYEQYFEADLKAGGVQRRAALIMLIADSEAELKTKILEICNDTELHSRMSAAARHTYETEMQIENMFQGFIDAIRFVGK